MYRTIHKNTLLEPEKHYHIFNRAVGDELLFREDTDYCYFLDKIERFILPVADLISYCLIPNHFHLFIKVLNQETILANLKIVHLESMEDKLNQSFSNFFNSFTKTYNLRYNRKGKLFLLPYKKKLVEEESYFISIINYIHRNPLHHGLTSDHKSWKYSSFNTYLSKGETRIRRDIGLEYFGDLNSFIRFHIENKMKPGSEEYLTDST